MCSRMLEISFLLVVVIVVALVFDFTNGAHDTANAIATVVSTRVLSPAIAVMMAALLNLIGALIGTHVAQTIGSGIVHPDMIKGCQALAILGVGASKRLSAVRWRVAGRMITAWILTIPAAGAVAAFCFELMRLTGLVD